MTTNILIIEDEPSIVDNIRYAIETEGYEAMCASTGAQALTLLKQNPIELIILDIGLPDINGFELIKQIRNTHNIPVIFLTARAAEIDRVVGLELGADDYVTKPFSPRELSARIKAILRRTQNTQTEQKESNNQFGPFVIDEQKCRIAYFDKTVELSRYEYKLLLQLIKKPGCIFSRDQLMNKVWDDPLASMDRTVDAHIKSLRNKLKQINQDLDPIQTHRGMGYSLKETF